MVDNRSLHYTLWVANRASQSDPQNGPNSRSVTTYSCIFSSCWKPAGHPLQPAFGLETPKHKKLQLPLLWGQLPPKGGIQVTPSTHPGEEASWPSLAPSRESPWRWQAPPHLLLSLGRGRGKAGDEQQCHHGGRTRTPEPPRQGHVRLPPLAAGRNFLPARSEGGAWEWASRSLVAPHWPGSALPGDPSHYVTRRRRPLKKKKKKLFASDWFQGANREKIIWRFLIGLLKRLHRPFCGAWRRRGLRISMRMRNCASLSLYFLEGSVEQNGLYV